MNIATQINCQNGFDFIFKVETIPGKGKKED